MDIVPSVLQIVKLAWNPIGRRIGYIKNLKKNIIVLKNDASYLFARRDDMEAMIKREIRKVKTNECNQWLVDVKEIERQVNVIQDEYEEDKKCIAGWCPNVCSRMKLGKRVEEIIKEITDLSNKYSAFEGKELCDAPLEKVQPQNVEDNSSTATKRTLQKIVGFIEDDNIQMIGVWGMGGVGKTRVMGLLNNQLEKSQTFEVIIWVTVSKEGDERKVQSEIAEQLELRASESHDQLKATIFQTLRRKKFLLLLDDIWNLIELSDVGIPTRNHQVNGCKVVLTTRSLDVCRQMNTDEEVKVETLSEDEAWKLFTKKTGDVAMDTKIEPIARDIVAECDGLPLAIIVLGSSLRKFRDVLVWENTLRELQLPATSQIEAMEERVFRCLRSSYDLLRDDCKKKVFLYCSLYPEDYEIFIAEMVEYCWLEGYIQGVDSIEDAQKKGHTMIMNLVDASLLEKCDEGYVKMHDVLRDFALREAPGFLVKAGMNIRHLPVEKEWLQAQKISLMRSSCRNLLLERPPNCRNLTTLLLQNNYVLTIISDSFFEHMHSLRILDLSWTKIESLPSSLSNLDNLRGLYLKVCKNLKELPSQVGALKRLEVLDLGGIRYLPREVGELTGLKRLIFRFDEHNCFQTDEDTREWNMKLRVPTGIFPNLPKMEELSLVLLNSFEDPCHKFSSVCVEKEQWDDESMEVVVDELCSLEHLTHLDVYFPKVESLERFLRHGKSVKASWFKSFRFRVGTEKAPFGRGATIDENWKRCLLYKGGVGMSHAAITETLAHCANFLLQDHQTARDLLEFGPANMNELEGCRVSRCDKMKTLFDRDGEQQTCALLPNLKELEIWGLLNLRSLCVGPLYNGTLSKLTVLYLDRCPKLKTVFQLSIIQQLCSLEFLMVRDCSRVEEIIEVKEEMSVASNDKVILPNIQCILLYNLPELVSMCRGFCNFEWPSLGIIEIVRCPKLKSLSFLSQGTNVVAPALKDIRGENEWWEALEWDDNDSKQQLQPFFWSLPSNCV